ncbi:unnamed protein product [Scytosiphon promiscuus]
MSLPGANIAGVRQMRAGSWHTMWTAIVALTFLFSPVLSFSVGGALVTSQHKKAILTATRSFPIRASASSSSHAEPSEVPAGTTGAHDFVSGKSCAELVTDLLGKIEGTNRGVDCTLDQRTEIDAIIEQLNVSGEGKEWLKDSRVFGNYNVAYVSSGSSERGNPAGGRWRGRVGRSLFRTEEMFQHLVEPATAVNMIVFRALGLLRLCVTLRGDFEAIPDRPNFVKASFGAPLVTFFGKRGLTIQSGPKSSVQLAATYVDERIRLGKGGRGSLFVFTRGGSADTPQANEWEVYASDGARPVKSRFLAAAMACGAVLAAARSAFVPAGVLAIVSVVLAAAQGGAIPDEPKEAGQAESRDGVP